MKKKSIDTTALVCICALIVVIVSAVILWLIAHRTKGDIPADETEESSVLDTGQSPEVTEPSSGTISADGTIAIKKIASFSGVFVEDGSDRLADGVAAILITNTSDRYLDLGNITYRIDGKTATFIVTGLPPGKSAWVMEYSGMTIDEDSKATYLDCSNSFRDDVISRTDDLIINLDGNFMVVKNNTNRTLRNVFVYYKTIHEDGNYFGGITYMVELGSLEPGQSTQKLAAHYLEGESEIVRIGWQEGEAPS